MTITATIPNGTALSQVIDLKGRAVARIRLPAGWTAANLTFLVDDEAAPVSYYDDAGVEMTVLAAAARSIRLKPQDWDGVRYLQIRSGTLAVPVLQGADRVLTIYTVSRD